MPLTPYVNAVLVFYASDADATGAYTVNVIAHEENPRFARGEWETMRQSLEPIGSMPPADVEFDEGADFRVRTLGIERYAVRRAANSLLTGLSSRSHAGRRY
jgi:hypothetical protein